MWYYEPLAFFYFVDHCTKLGGGRNEELEIKN